MQEGGVLKVTTPNNAGHSIQALLGETTMSGLTGTNKTIYSLPTVMQAAVPITAENGIQLDVFSNDLFLFL